MADICQRGQSVGLVSYEANSNLVNDFGGEATNPPSGRSPGDSAPAGWTKEEKGSTGPYQTPWVSGFYVHVAMACTVSEKCWSVSKSAPQLESKAVQAARPTSANQMRQREVPNITIETPAQ